MFFYFVTVDDEHMSKQYEKMKSFEERCCEKFRCSNSIVLRGTVEEEVAKISEEVAKISDR